MTLSELERYLCSGDFRVESDGEKIWLEGPSGWHLTDDDPPDVRLVLADEPHLLRKMLPQIQALHVMDRIAAALTVCRDIPTAELRRAARESYAPDESSRDCSRAPASREDPAFRIR